MLCCQVIYHEVLWRLECRSSVSEITLHFFSESILTQRALGFFFFPSVAHSLGKISLQLGHTHTKYYHHLGSMYKYQY